MLNQNAPASVYIACGSTDLRKSYSGLAAIVKLRFNLDPYSKCMFAFCNSSRNLIKILQWDGTGFWIYSKRLSEGNFKWPQNPGEVQQVSLKEIKWLCDGLTLEPKGAFKEKHPAIVL